MAEAQLNELKNALGDVQSSVSSLFADKKNKGAVKSEVQTHLMRQIESLGTRIDSLEKTISVGIPLTEATESIQKLENIQRNIDALDSKLNLYTSNAKELKEKSEELNKILSAKVNRNQIDSLREKLIYLEKLYSELSVSKTNESLTSMLEILENLRNRIKTLESEVEKEFGFYLDTGNTKQGADGQQAKRNDANKQAIAEPIPVKKSFFSKLFSGLFKKKGVA